MTNFINVVKDFWRAEWPFLTGVILVLVVVLFICLTWISEPGDEDGL